MAYYYKLAEKVIVKHNGANLVGVIIDRSIMNKRRTFDVRTENGFEIPHVPVDDKKSKCYIDSELTKKILPNISTNLNEELRGNIKQNNI